MWESYLDEGSFEYTGTIVDAYFGVNPEYNADTVRITLKLEDLDGIDRDDWTEGYNVGKVEKFDVVDGGATLEPVTPKTKPNTRSGYGEFIRKLGEILPSEVKAELEQRGNPFQAHIYKGLRLRFASQEKSFKNQADETVTYNVRMPVEYAGQGEVAAAAEASTNGNTEALRNTLETLARAASSHDQFVERALQVKGVTDHDDLLTEIVDEAGLYATARA